MEPRTILATGLVLLATACAHSDPTPPPAPPATLTAATCPCALADGGMPCGDGTRMRGGPGSMGPGRGGPMMSGGGPMMMGTPATPGVAAAASPLSAEARSALLRALDEEYRAEALYVHIANRLGAKPPVAMIARAEHRHAWVLESLALAHGVDLPANAWPTTKQPDFANTAAACRAGADSERKTIAAYDEFLKVDLPPDLRRAFTNLRAASAERHLPAFDACR